MAADNAGNVYIADAMNNRVRRVGPDGVIWTVAGNGNSGYSGDGGPATSALLNGPSALALNAQGDLYFQDYGNRRIRKVTRGGIISTYAGNGGQDWGCLSGAATGTPISNIGGMAVDKSANLYFSNSVYSCVGLVSPQGVVSTYAGTGDLNFSGDGGPAASATLALPQGLAADAAGDLFIADADNSRVRMINAAGIISTYAGGGTDTSGNTGPATGVYFGGPAGVAVDTAGNLYVLQHTPARVFKVTPDGILSVVEACFPSCRWPRIRSACNWPEFL